MTTILSSSTISNPELWRLSLLIRKGSVDVLARRIIVGDNDDRAITASLPYISDATNESFKELFFSNPLLFERFGKVDVLLSRGFSVLQPLDSTISHIDTLFPQSVDSNLWHTLSDDIDSHTKIIFRAERSILNFIRRTFPGITPRHELSVLSKYFLHQSRLGNSHRVYVNICDNYLNVVITDNKGVCMASSFNFSNIDDAAYYVLASASTAGFNFSNDEIRVSGDSARRALLMPVLRRFARHVMPDIFPSSAIGDDSSVISSPLSLVVIPLCE